MEKRKKWKRDVEYQDSISGYQKANMWEEYRDIIIRLFYCWRNSMWNVKFLYNQILLYSFYVFMEPIFRGRVNLSDVKLNPDNRKISKKRVMMLEAQMMKSVLDSQNPIILITKVRNQRCVMTMKFKILGSFCYTDDQKWQIERQVDVHCWPSPD
jgi:hypothetical protein